MSYLEYDDSTPKLKVHGGINVASSTFTSIPKVHQKECLQRRKMRGDMEIRVGEGRCSISNLEIWNHLFWYIIDQPFVSLTIQTLSSSHPVGLPRHRQSSIDPGTKPAVDVFLCKSSCMSYIYTYIFMLPFKHIYIYVHTYVWNKMFVYIFRLHRISSFLRTHIYLKIPLYFRTCVSPGFLWSIIQPLVWMM